MNKTLLVILAFLGVFVCGAVVGGVVTFRFGRQAVQKKAAEHIGLQQWRKMGEQMELTAEQREKIRPLVVRAAQDRQAALKQAQMFNDRLVEDVEALLTPEQRAKFQELRKRQRDDERLWQRWVREQRVRRGEMAPLGGEREGPGMPPPLNKR